MGRLPAAQLSWSSATRRLTVGDMTSADRARQYLLRHPEARAAHDRGDHNAGSPIAFASYPAPRPSGHITPKLNGAQRAAGVPAAASASEAHTLQVRHGL